MEAMASKRTSAAPAIAFDDLVRLNSAHVRTNRPTKKLDDRWLGPYRVTKQTGSHNFRLAVGKVHDVFHVDRLRPYIEPTSFPGRPAPSRPPAEIDDPEAFEVERILDSRRRRRRIQYFLHWLGYKTEDCSWVEATDFDADDSLVVDFRTRNPSKPTHGVAVF